MLKLDLNRCRIAGNEKTPSGTDIRWGKRFSNQLSTGRVGYPRPYLFTQKPLFKGIRVPHVEDQDG